jgi:dipeptidyl aminopeptidase/acylaminoacyl peptidase
MMWSTRSKRLPAPFRLVLALVLGSAAALQAQDNAAVLAQEAYLTPPPEIADAVLAPRHLNVSLSNANPARTHFLLTQSEGLPSLAAFAKRHYNLGGFQVDPRANRARVLTTRGSAGFDIMALEGGRRITVDVPANASVSNPTWSPDGRRVAFFAHTDDATHIWVADAETGRSRQVTRTPVLATLYTGYDWLPDGRSIVAVLVPEGRGPEPPAAAVPTEPLVRMTMPGRNALRTYPSLLETPRDMALVEYYATGQLAVIDVTSRSVRRVGQPAMIRSVDVAPDGRHARVTTMRKPFSYIVPVSQFGSAEEIWSLQNGQVLATVSEQPIRHGLPADTAGQAADPGRRSASWRPDGQGLSFLQLAPAPARADTADAGRDGQAQGQTPRRRDRVMQWLPPFAEGSEQVVYENESRLSSVRYSEDGRILFLSEGQGQATHEFAVFADAPDQRHTLARRRANDVRNDPGTLLLRRGGGGPGFGGGFGGFGGGAAGTVLVSSDGEHVFLSGTKYYENPMQDAPRSFIDRVHIRTGEKTRIYESENEGVFERVAEVLDDDVTRILVVRESPTQVPDTYLRVLGSGQLTRLTANEDYTPDLTRAKRRQLDVRRPDGFTFKVDVTLPENHRDGQRLPAMFWFYPREYTDQESYDRTRATYNKNRFPNIGVRSMDILVRQGYAVVSPDAPITGEQGRMNDNYVHDLRNNLAAVIDLLDKEGMIDRERLGIGGHSYGGFGTVNAMVHTPFFKAGIAGAGNYNRTLTPFAFQSERRTLWEAREVYLAMSPLLYANNLTGALLLYHGAQDQNVGTFPINSWRLFDALQALDKTAALYVYPYEDHGQQARETLLDMWARWTAWLDTYVRNAGETRRATTDQDD